MQTQSITFRATVPHLWGAQGFGTSYYLEDPDGNEVELRTYDAGTKDVQIRVEWMLASQLVDRLDSPLREAVTGVFGNTRCLVVWGNHQALGVLVACADEPRVVVLPAWAHLPIEHRLRARYELATSERSER